MDRKVKVGIMSIQPLVPNAEDVLVLVNSVSDAAERLEDEIEAVEAILAEDPDNFEATINLCALRGQLESIALTRGRLQPFYEEVLDQTYAVEQ